MSKPLEQKPTRTSAKPAENIRTPASANDAVKASLIDAKPNPKETAQEAIHQVMSKEDAKLAAPPAVPAKEPAFTPSTAASGDDDIMSSVPKKQ